MVAMSYVAHSVHGVSVMKWAVRLVDEQASHLLGHGPARVRATHQQRHKPNGGNLAVSFMAQVACSVSSKGKSSCSLCRWAGLSPTGTWACRDEGYPSCRLCRVVIVQMVIMSWFKGVHVKWREMSCALYGGAGLLPTRQVRSTHSAECYVEELQWLLILIVLVPWINHLLSLCNVRPSSGTSVEMMVLSKFSIMRIICYCSCKLIDIPIF